MSRRKKPIEEPGGEFSYLFPSASTGDMTGLIPAEPEHSDDDDETRESYDELYPQRPEVVDNG
ncbi:MAG: hypothetical protein IJ874_08145 [Ruminococcus sp.]|nr:hypothetical protein [Ruminococcus sp.]